MITEKVQRQLNKENLSTNGAWTTGCPQAEGTKKKKKEPRPKAYILCNNSVWIIDINAKYKIYKF